MTLLNPAYGIILPILFVFTIPVALVAAFTTFLAISILLFRVTLIYLELAVAIIQYYLFGTKSDPKIYSKHFTTQTGVPIRRRKRRSSTNSSFSAGTITSISSDTGFGLSKSIGPARDFEGVGGWNLGDDDWTNINSRLELPAHHGRRHHQRSFTSGSAPGDGRSVRAFSPEASMNISRARTPPALGMPFASDGYFSQAPSSPRALKRTASGFTGVSPGTFKSSGLTMKQR
jgi:hypothetical protein